MARPGDPRRRLADYPASSSSSWRPPPRRCCPSCSTTGSTSPSSTLPVDDPDIDTDMLFTEERIIITPLDHPLAEHEVIDLAALADYEILLPPKGTAFRDEIDTDARRAQVTLRARAEVDGLRLLSSLAFQGFGPTLVPSSAAPSWLTGEWKRVAVDGLSPRVVGLATRRRRSPSAPTRTLAALIRDIVVVDGPREGHITPALGENG
ncbi:MAG: LysR family transcriptional regulator substrate-binding protein [Acidimicrobiales bacterium]